MQPQLELAAKLLAETEGLGEEYWQDYIKTARTVLIAIRKPNEAMKIAGGRSIAPNIMDVPDNSPHWETENEMRDRCLYEVETSWTAMIDNILEQAPPFQGEHEKYDGKSISNVSAQNIPNGG